jgi:hypothetical protein
MTSFQQSPRREGKGRPRESQVLTVLESAGWTTTLVIRIGAMKANEKCGAIEPRSD